MSNKTQTYIDFIVNELRAENVNWSSNIGLFMGKFGVTEETFRKYWKLANEAYEIELQQNNKQKLDIHKSKEIKEYRAQIEHSTQRTISMQSQAKKIESELESGKTKDIIGFKDGKAQVVERDLTVLEKTTLIKTLVALYAEIAKREGDYVANKVEIVEGINIIIE